MEQQQTPKGKPMKFGLKVALNILAMIVLAVFVFWLCTFFLDFWTRHGDSVTVPDVRGMQFEKARETLEDNGFQVILQDSIYDDSHRPGEVTDQNPAQSANVKPGREVFLTINAFHPRTVMLPSLTDISIRQARSTLEGLGLTDYRIDTVPSDYKDLVISVTCDGRPVRPGQRIPVTSRLVIKIGQGPLEPLNVDVEDVYGADSTAVESESVPEESDPVFD